MDQVSDLSEVQYGEPGDIGVRPAREQQRTGKLSLSDCRLLQLHSVEEASDIINAYQALDIPKEATFALIDHLTQRRDAWFVDVGGAGLFYLTGIVLHFTANVNVVFWDKKFGRDRRDIVQCLSVRVFELFDLQRLQATVPASNVPLRTQLERAGFTVEGALRNGWYDAMGLQTLYVLGMVREERPECPLQATTSLALDI
jgi:hypothetical protein